MQPVAFRNTPLVLSTLVPAVRSGNAEQPQELPGTIPAGVPASDTGKSAVSDRRPPVFPASLSAGDLDTLQSVDHGKSQDSSAMQARAAIAANPDLAGVPFGHIVSQIARGETPVVTPEPTSDSTDGVSDTPPPSTGDVADLPPSDGGTPPTDTASDTPPAGTSTDTVSSDVPPSDTDTSSDPVVASDTPTDTSTDPAVSDPSIPGPTTSGIDPEQALLDALTA